MFEVTRLIHVSDHPDRDRLLAKLRQVATSAERALVEPTLPGVRNGGDILMHLRFAHEDQWTTLAAELTRVLSAPAVTHIDGVEYHGTPVLARQRAPGAVYRTLLLRVAPDTDDATVERFEGDLRLLPRYVQAITAWQLSRVTSAIGASPWTHVYEQRFVSIEGLMGPYLMHPIHWAYVDRWFDPECPEVIVRDRVCHSFCRAGTEVLD
ncbi:MAG: Dabb family protein [Mycobacteriaceae bacterium]|nr:Dabb family protein [Mycobacteriaceae bacterium]